MQKQILIYELNILFINIGMKKAQNLVPTQLYGSPQHFHRYSPTLNDSKSFSYLPNLSNSNKDQNKFRETTSNTVSQKNQNYDFLRYTINPLKNSSEHPKNIESKKLQKNCQKIPSEHQLQASNEETQGNKNVHYYSQNDIAPRKKGSQVPQSSNLQKKCSIQSQISSKNPPHTIQDPLLPFSAKLYRAKTATFYTPKRSKPTPFPITQKKQKTMTPLYTKGLTQGYLSSSDLLKDNASSPTSQSVTSKKVGGWFWRKTPKIEDFGIGKVLGEGKFGLVYMVIHKQTSAIFALKKIKKESITKNKLENQFIMQIKMQLHFNHPNILKLYGFFSDDEHIYLILEYMEDGTLYSHLKKHRVLTQSSASQKLRDVLSGIIYIHERKIAHRDLKPQNIVMSHDVCKICDFGWAAICDDRRQTMCGTIDYACPEILQGKEYGIAIDLWCLGVLCYELMVGKAPFYHISRKETMKKIIKADTSDINIPVQISEETCDFIYKLLRKDPEERMRAEEAIKHCLIQKYKDEEIQELRKSVEKGTY